jgi:uncharacterized protein
MQCRSSICRRFDYVTALPSCTFLFLVTAGMAAAAPAANYAGVAEPQVKPAFLPLPPGAIEPRGWLRDWAQAARDGITGHLDEQNPTFRDAWKGIPIEVPYYADPADKTTGWPLEQGAYWLDGALRLGYILHDDALIQKITKRLDILVDGVNHGGTSLICWQKGKPKTVFNSWAHSHMGRALVAWYMATGDRRILDALVKAYCNYPAPMGHLEFQADISGLCNIDAMLETYRLSGDRRILRSVQAAMAAPDVQKTLDLWCKGQFNTGHAVCAYEQIRLPILFYPWTGEAGFRDASCKAFQNFRDEHMLPYGVTSGEEWLSGIGAFRLTETCDVAAHLWSTSWMYRILGDRSYGDSMERAFFNAAPGPVSRDFKTMSYLQAPNRIQPDRLPIGWTPDCLRFTPLANPNVLCCVGAVNRIIPTYVTHMWTATYDGGLAATLYGPNTVSAMVGNKIPVKISCDTAYPFEETIRIAVDPRQETAFPLYLRLPAWCAKPRISVNGSAIDATPSATGFARIERTWKPGDVVSLSLPMSVAVARGYEREYPESSRVYFKDRPSANYQRRRLPYETVSYGPLLFALPIPDIDANTPMKNAKWQYALDNDARKSGRDIAVARKPMPEHWAWPLDAPITLRVPARQFDWRPTEVQALPGAPVDSKHARVIRLVPYGCTKFRISMFPVTPQAWGE